MKESIIQRMNKILIIVFVFFAFVLKAQPNQREMDSLQTIVTTETQAEKVQDAQAALVILYYRNGESDKALNLYYSTLQAAGSIHNLKALGQLYHNMGILQFYNYQIDSAIHYFRRALRMRAQSGDYIGMLKTISNLASNYFMQSDFKQALQYYKVGMELENALGYGEGEYIDLKNMAIAYRYLKLYNKALVIYRKSLRAPKLSTKNYYTIYSGMAFVFKDLQQHDSAYIYVNRSHHAALQLNDSLEMAYSCSNLGLIQNGLKHYDTASMFFRRALNLSRATGEKHLELASWANLGANHIEMGRIDSSEKYIQKVLELRKEMNLKTDEEDLSKLFAEYYHRKGEFEKSYAYFKTYDHYRDSIYTLESTAKSLEAQEKFESEKKEKENQLLQLENNAVKSSRNYLMVFLCMACVTLLFAIFAYRKIKRSNRLLAEQKISIEQKNALLQSQKTEIEHQKELVEEKQKEILDSINYARRIQFALLASKTMLEKHLPEHFVLFKPKDVVSGDFYWASPVNNGFVLVTADCTGHGVPGAFMSLLNISKLSETINEKNIVRPDLILNEVRKEIIAALNTGDEGNESKDGMDAIVCHFDFPSRKLTYAAANNSFYLIRDSSLILCEADKMPVGKGHDDTVMFSLRSVDLKPGDRLYTLTDGFADQFGGPKGKKFKYKQLEEFLLQHHHQPMQLQREKLETAFEVWKGDLEQVDDICVIGIHIP